MKLGNNESGHRRRRYACEGIRHRARDAAVADECYNEFRIASLWEPCALVPRAIDRLLADGYWGCCITRS
jgi:hypothetical protein